VLRVQWSGGMPVFPGFPQADGPWSFGTKRHGRSGIQGGGGGGGGREALRKDVGWKRKTTIPRTAFFCFGLCRETDDNNRDISYISWASDPMDQPPAQQRSRNTRVPSEYLSCLIRSRPDPRSTAIYITPLNTPPSSPLSPFLPQKSSHVFVDFSIGLPPVN